jgi:hypothetical protein
VKKILAIIISAASIFAFSVSGHTESWSYPGLKGNSTDSQETCNEPFASILAISPSGSLEAFSGLGVAPFIPVRFDQFVVSFLDARKPGSVFRFDEQPLISRIQVNSGIKTESYLPPPQSLLLDSAFNEDSGALGIQSSVIFVGLGLDLDSFFLKGSAFVGHPMETFSDQLPGNQNSEILKHPGVNTDAHGFEAAAGYQLSDMIALGAGFGKMKDKNKETDQSEEVYAVYAQAILAIAPGVQVKPKVGKVDRIKEENKTDEMEIDESFYAGAIWEINF